jgi:hypothetical protein
MSMSLEKKKKMDLITTVRIGGLHHKRVCRIQFVTLPSFGTPPPFYASPDCHPMSFTVELCSFRRGPSWGKRGCRLGVSTKAIFRLVIISALGSGRSSLMIPTWFLQT